MSKAQAIVKLIAQKTLKYFLRGLLLVLPVVGTIWLVYFLVTKIDNLLDFTNVPGLGIVIIFIGVTLIGAFGSGLLVQPILDIVDDLLERVPGVKIIYTSIKEFMEAFVGDKRKFKEPVVVDMGNGLHRMGFITQKDLTIIDMEGYVTVYFPHSYNFSGNVYIVPAEKVRHIDTNPSEVMKFVVTGGVTELGSGAGMEEDEETK
jgi:uncharacterized membrane protein